MIELISLIVVIYLVRKYLIWKDKKNKLKQTTDYYGYVMDKLEK